MSHLRVRALSFACLIVVSACEDQKPEPTPSPAQSPAPSVLATAAEAAAAPTTPPSPAKRPKVDLELTSERRTAIEAKHPESRGFLAAKELEEKLKANKAIKAKAGALTAFDRAAKGKWVLFSGLMVNLTDTGFDIAVVYTPQLPNDVMGMSRQFFEVTLNEIEGYRAGQFKTGDPVVVLAKYLGAGKAAPGYELVATEVWK